MSLTLIALGIKIFPGNYPYSASADFRSKEAELILVLLSLIDMALVGGWIVMVMISSYENFVSRLDIRRT